MAVFAHSQSKKYYISNLGNNVNTGTSPASPWRSVAKINSVDLNAGDTVFFRGGEVHAGTIELTKEDVAYKMNPIVITSYGQGRATIKADEGVSAYNAAGIEIYNLRFLGNDTAYKDGICFLIDQTHSGLNYVRIRNVEISNFGRRGISIGAHLTDKGFEDVRISHSNIHDNDHSGIETFGYYPRVNHRNFYIGFCKTYNNHGTFFTGTASGNGIVVSGVDGALVEYCEAFNNGKNNRNNGGGPVGIWTYDTRNVTIQYCESHHNKAGLRKDGGGFDIDGGSQNCVVQYCYSHDNEGPGFGMFEYGSPTPYTGNVIRYNISQNDGRKNGSGALSFWGRDALHLITNSRVYNNTFFSDSLNVVNGRPAAVEIYDPYMSGIQVVNNIFYTTSGVSLVKSSHSISPNGIHFRNNSYYSLGTPLFEWGGKDLYSLSQWKAAAAGQEKEGQLQLGYDKDPMLAAPGTGSTVGVAAGGNLAGLTAYRLTSQSPLIDAGIIVVSEDVPDFFGVIVGTDLRADVGASEYRAPRVSGPQLLEAEEATLNGAVRAANHAGYTGEGFADYLNRFGDYVEWTIDKSSAGTVSLAFRYANGSYQDRPLRLEVNGKVIVDSLSFPVTGSWPKWSVSNTNAQLMAGRNKVRITAIGFSGVNIDHLVWSEGEITGGIASLSRSEISSSFKVTVVPNPVTSTARLIISGAGDSPLQIHVVDMSGRTISRSPKNIGTGIYELRVDNLAPGVYTALVTTDTQIATARFIVLNR
jgi:hypothetical protein